MPCLGDFTKKQRSETSLSRTPVFRGQGNGTATWSKKSTKTDQEERQPQSAIVRSSLLRPMPLSGVNKFTSFVLMPIIFRIRQGESMFSDRVLEIGTKA